MTYPGPSTTTYAFDAFGNRTSMTNGSGTTSYTYDDADRITEVQPPSPASAISYTWDDNGNLTDRGADSFEWDYEDRMVEATVNSVTSTFAYRGDGLRDSRTVGMTTTTFTWDINAGLPVVLDDGNQYLYGAGLSAMKQSGDWFYYLADGLGSTMAVVDAAGDVENGYTYDVYGEPTATGSLANEFDFAGQQTDGSTGLQYLRARYYDPATGVFVSRDPLASSPAWLEPAFTYAGGSPSAFSDPLGLDRCGWKDPWECAKNAGSKIGGATEGAAAAAAGRLQEATNALWDFASGKVQDPLVQLSLAQAAAGLAAALACPAAVVSGGAAAPACAAAIALVGYTIWAKQEIIRARYRDGQYNEAEFACRLLTSAPIPVPGVLPGISMPLCSAAGKLQDLAEEGLGSGVDSGTPLNEKSLTGR